MADDETDGLLSQADIDAAMAADSDAVDDASSAESSSEGEAASLSQEDLDEALALAGEAPGVEVPSADAGADSRVDSAGRPFDEVAAAMAAAMAGERAAGPVPSAQRFEIPALAAAATARATPGMQAIELLRDVQLDVKIELGRSRMLVDDVLRLGEGSVVELDKLAGDPVDVFVNDRLVARGEVLVLNDNFCVRINDIVRQEPDEEATN